MRARLPTLLPTTLLLTLIWLLTVPLGVAASSGLPSTVTMDPPSAGPGETVEVTGLDFPGLEVVELRVVTGSGAVPLVDTVSADSGYFREMVTLPTGIEAGIWELRANALDGSAATYRFDAAGAAGAAAAAADTSGADGAAGNSGVNVIVMLVIAVVLAAIGGAGAYVWREVHQGGRQPGMGFAEDPIWGGGANDEAAVELTAVDEPVWAAAHGES